MKVTLAQLQLLLWLRLTASDPFLIVEHVRLSLLLLLHSALQILLSLQKVPAVSLRFLHLLLEFIVGHVLWMELSLDH